MIIPIALIIVSLGILLAAASIRLLALDKKVKTLDEEAGVFSAKLAILSRFLRSSKTLQAELADFNKNLQQDEYRKAENFALERWLSFRDKRRFGHWRVEEGKQSKNETRDDSFSDSIDSEREYQLRLNARPYLSVLHHKMPFVVSQDHLEWLDKTDSVRGFLEWLIGDVEKGSQGKPPAELDALKTLLSGK